MMKSEKKATKKVEWGCKFMITVNKPTLTALICSVTLGDFPCKAIAWKEAYEVGEKGNLHKHLYIVLERSVRRDKYVRKL